MANPLRIGLIGLDTSHVVRFAQCLNRPDEPNRIPGATIVAGFPGASEDFELSRSRVEGFTRELSDDYGVEILESPEAVAAAVDLVFISSVDGRRHREFLRATLPHKRPTFVDKPFATTLSDAKAMYGEARAAGVPLMSSSALRYADNLVEARSRQDDGKIVGCDAFGPMHIEPTQPGLFFYGIHCVEMIVSVLGAGCRRVQALTNDGSDVIAAEWSDGRMASIRGLRDGHSKFGIALHRSEGFQFVDISANKRPHYAGLLEAIMRTLPQGRSDVPEQETLEVVRFMESANRSRETGQVVEL